MVEISSTDLARARSGRPLLATLQRHLAFTESKLQPRDRRRRQWGNARVRRARLHAVAGSIKMKDRQGTCAPDCGARTAL